MDAHRAEGSRRSAKRLLWVTDEPPNRRSGGGGIRQSYLLEALARRFAVDLLQVGPFEDEDLRPFLNRIHEVRGSRPPTRKGPFARRLYLLAISLLWPGPGETWASRRSRRSLKRALARLAESVDIVVVVHSHVAPVIPPSRSGTWVLNLHHLLSVMAQQEHHKALGRRQRWMWRRQHRKACRLEDGAARLFDAVVTCSAEDAAVLQSRNAGATVAVVPNGVNLARFAATPVPPEARLLLPASLHYAPNVDGALWFCDEVMPILRRDVPHVTLDIVGRSPVPEILALATHPNVRVEADVPTLEPFFQAARVVVVPLRVGTGTRLKALEAMASGRPLVGTAIGLEGLGLVDRVTARVADDPEAMAAAIVEILTDDAVAMSLAQAARAIAEEHYDWTGIGERHAVWLDDLSSAPRREPDPSDVHLPAP